MPWVQPNLWKPNSELDIYYQYLLLIRIIVKLPFKIILKFINKSLKEKLKLPNKMKKREIMPKNGFFLLKPSQNFYPFSKNLKNSLKSNFHLKSIHSKMHLLICLKMYKRNSRIELKIIAKCFFIILLIISSDKLKLYLKDKWD